MNKIIVLLFLAIISCTNLDPNFNTNPDFSKNGRYGDFKIDTLYAVKDSLFESSELNTNASVKLSLANMDGMKAAFVVRFINLPADSIPVSSVDFSFSTYSFFGDTTKQTAQVSLYKANKLWDLSSIVNQDDDWRTNPPDELISELTITLRDSAVNHVNIPLTLFNEWRTNPDSLNYGLYLKLSDSEKNLVCEFNSINSAEHPVLRYSMATDSVDTVAATNDATIFDYDKLNGTALAGNQLFISSGIPYRTLIKFDLTNIPKDAIYYSTDVKIAEDDNNPYKNPNKTQSIAFRALSSLANEEFNPATVFGMGKNGDYLKLNTPDLFGTRFTQQLVNDTFVNEWFVIQYLDEASDISKITLKGINSTQAPMLILKYFTNK